MRDWFTYDILATSKHSLVLCDYILLDYKNSITHIDKCIKSTHLPNRHNATTI